MSLPTNFQITPHDVFTWLASKRGSFRYLDKQNCLVAQFVKDKGGETVAAGGYSVHADGKVYHIPDSVTQAAHTESFTHARTVLGTLLGDLK